MVKMHILEAILPFLLLFLCFLLKLLIDRSVTLPQFINAAFELPVDIAFLSLAFIVAFTISDPENVQEGMIRFIIYLIGTICIVFLWRRSIIYFTLNKQWVSYILSVMSYGLCITGLVLAVGMLTR